MGSTLSLAARDLALLRRRLRAWFDRHARDLPWRRTRDPYAIWISEVMLQQTQVATVIPYYRRFLERFPNLAALARAQEQQVLQSWEGLGYYRRAQALCQAARIIFAEQGGVFPRLPAQLQALPGFGRYTVNAVLSQAFDARLPILEANSERVLCRLLGMAEHPRKNRQRLWQAAEQLLPRGRVGVFNQALMEVGALVCKPSRPDCPSCPLTRWCQARAQGRQEDIPQRTLRRPVAEVHEVGVAVWHKGRVLWTQRPDQGRWPTMWEFPHVPLTPGETHEAAARRLLKQLGIHAHLGKKLATIRHAVTRFRIHLVCLTAHRQGRFRSGAAQVKGRWVFPGQLKDYPVSVPQRKLAQLVSRND